MYIFVLDRVPELGVKARASHDTLGFCCASQRTWDKEVRSLWHRPGTKKGTHESRGNGNNKWAALRQHGVASAQQAFLKLLPLLCIHTE